MKNEEQQNKILIYKTGDGKTDNKVRFENEDVWLSQQQMAELYQTSRTNVVEHIKHIFEEGEFTEEATCQKSRQVQIEGKSYLEEHPEQSMKFIDEYRDPALAGRLLEEIRQTVTRPWVVMEICGGHTHAIMKGGLDQLLPAQVELVHGPGCPVCVTPVETIDRAVAIAGRPEVIFASFGDMLRVPGSVSSLFMAKSAGADVRMVYSPLEAVALARQNPEREVVFLAVGFETTAPGNAMALLQARREGLTNFSLLASHVLVPPAIRALLSSPGNRVQGYLAPGHVCTVMGWREYEPLAEEFKVPIVVTGFEPLDILAGLLMVLRQLEAGGHAVENQYGRSVSREGNPAAQRVLAEVFAVRDRPWRGIGVLPASGLVIREHLAAYDAEKKFAVTTIKVQESTQCKSGSVLQGMLKPDGCPAFGRECTPEHPLGATMVSGEGACAAYYKYHRTSHA